MNAEATNEYRRQMLYALGLAESITQKIKADRDASATKPVTWGHVGDATYLQEQLQEIENRLFGCGEYASDNVAKVGR